jgi:hypothetical protein
VIRPLRKSLSQEAIDLMNEQRAQGFTPLPIHMMLVEETASGERGRTACNRGLGEWVTGAIEQVTCPPCLEQVHA